ncbi:hypothetical protein ACFT9I_07245 [Streptomyces sp. NPDC057137]|uniref:hypothetical protein n=1 Tax=Streptomyces sp. NPDC057137 TaxID=3346030 RepID=UPI00363AFD39
MPAFTAVGLCLVTAAACGQTPTAPQAAPIALDQTRCAAELKQSDDRFRRPPDYRPPDYRPDVDRLVEATRPAADERLPTGITRTEHAAAVCSSPPRPPPGG